MATPKVVSAPGFVAHPHRRRQLLAVCIRAGEAAEVPAFAGTNAGDEKGHVCLLCLPARTQGQGKQSSRRKQGQKQPRRAILKFESYHAAL